MKISSAKIVFDKDPSINSRTPHILDDDDNTLCGYTTKVGFTSLGHVNRNGNIEDRIKSVSICKVCKDLYIIGKWHQ